MAYCPQGYIIKMIIINVQTLKLIVLPYTVLYWFPLGGKVHARKWARQLLLFSILFVMTIASHNTAYRPCSTSIAIQHCKEKAWGIVFQIEQISRGVWRSPWGIVFPIEQISLFWDCSGTVIQGKRWQSISPFPYCRSGDLIGSSHTFETETCSVSAPGRSGLRAMASSDDPMLLSLQRLPQNFPCGCCYGLSLAFSMVIGYMGLTWHNQYISLILIYISNLLSGICR